ncbi:hypothetical protein [Halovulum sp. GXIMD14793]
MLKTLLTGAVCGVVALTSLAAPAGAQQAAIQPHVDAWLAGGDEEPLTALADAAAGGNSAAQVLLGQIDRDTVPGGSSDYLLSLSDNERDHLLRKGISENRTISWLLAMDDPSKQALSKALFGYRIALEPIQDSLALQQSNEILAAQYVAWTTLDNGRFDLVNTIPPNTPGLSDAGFLTWMRDYVSQPNKVMNTRRLLDDTNPAKVKGLLAINRMARMMNLDQFMSDEIKDLVTVLHGRRYALSEDADPISIRNTLIELAKYDAPLSILTRLCASCEQGEIDPDCISQSLDVIRGYRTLLSIRTPTEAVIPADDYFASDRAMITLRQAIRSNVGYYPRKIESTCVASFAQ